MAVGSKFDGFVSNIQLTETQLNDAQTKHINVRATLHNAFYSTAYNSSTSFLVGSYGKVTAVRPPSDIDIMFILPPSDLQRYNNLQGNKQSRLLQDIKSILFKTYQNTDLRADGQVVSVPFVSFAVEVVPCFHLTNGNFYICNTNSGGSWKEVAPKAEMESLTASNTRSNGNTVKLIKMMKVWKRYCNVPIKSFAIELLAKEFLGNWEYYNKPSVYHDWLVRDFLGFMINKTNSYLLTPGTYEVIYLGDDWKSRAESAYDRAQKACKFEADKDDAKATEEWKKIFGDLFLG